MLQRYINSPHVRTEMESGSNHIVIPFWMLARHVVVKRTFASPHLSLGWNAPWLLDNVKPWHHVFFSLRRGLCGWAPLCICAADKSTVKKGATGNEAVSGEKNKASKINHETHCRWFSWSTMSLDGWSFMSVVPQRHHILVPAQCSIAAVPADSAIGRWTGASWSTNVCTRTR